MLELQLKKIGLLVAQAVRWLVPVRGDEAFRAGAFQLFQLSFRMDAEARRWKCPSLICAIAQ